MLESQISINSFGAVEKKLIKSCFYVQVVKVLQALVLVYITYHTDPCVKC